MQIKKARELKEKWGQKKCDHPSFTKEYDLGAQTGDYVCTQCGESFSKSEVEKIEKTRFEA